MAERSGTVVTVPLRGFESDQDVTEFAAQVAADIQRLILVADHLDSLAAELRMRTINQLRAEGMDGDHGLKALFTGGNAVQAGNRVVSPLRAIHADMENAVRSAHAFKARVEQLVDSIREARSLAGRQQQGLKVS